MAQTQMGIRTGRLALLLLLACLTGLGLRPTRAAAQSADSSLFRIRDVVNAIDAQLPSRTVVEFEPDRLLGPNQLPGNSQIVAYKDGATIIKIAVSTFESGGAYLQEFYFHDSALVFLKQEQSTTSPNGARASTSTRRMYFDHDEFVGGVDDVGATLDPAKPELREDAKFALSFASQLEHAVTVGYPADSSMVEAADGSTVASIDSARAQYTSAPKQPAAAASGNAVSETEAKPSAPAIWFVGIATVALVLVIAKIVRRQKSRSLAGNLAVSAVCVGIVAVTGIAATQSDTGSNTWPAESVGTFQLKRIGKDGEVFAVNTFEISRDAVRMKVQLEGWIGDYTHRFSGVNEPSVCIATLPAPNKWFDDDVVVDYRCNDGDEIKDGRMYYAEKIATWMFTDSAGKERQQLERVSLADPKVTITDVLPRRTPPARSILLLGHWQMDGMLPGTVECRLHVNEDGSAQLLCPQADRGIVDLSWKGIPGIAGVELTIRNNRTVMQMSVYGMPGTVCGSAILMDGMLQFRCGIVSGRARQIQ